MFQCATLKIWEWDEVKYLHMYVHVYVYVYNVGMQVYCMLLVLHNIYPVENTLET